MRDSVVVVNDLHIAPSRCESLSLTYELLKRLGVFDGSWPWATSVAQRASVIWAVLLAYRLGFQTVVLIGMDISDSRNFYDVPGSPFFDGALTSDGANAEARHRTGDPRVRCDTVPVVLQHLAPKLESWGTMVRNGSPGFGSPLDEVLVNYDWSIS